jgi:8-oxo-dGTP pyrophosphatase MutT (NUDIX family)
MEVLPFFMDRLQLLNLLENYHTDFEEEYFFISRFRSLISNFKDAFSRSLITGHITASAWILDNNFGSAVLVHHRKLNKWLQPGGHTDGQEDVVAAAFREAKEETGLSNLQIVNDQIFDLDIHIIPPHGQVSAHFHYDIRFLILADKSEMPSVSHESHDVKWFNFHDVPEATGNSRSIQRMLLKSRKIR